MHIQEIFEEKYPNLSFLISFAKKGKRRTTEAETQLSDSFLEEYGKLKPTLILSIGSDLCEVLKMYQIIQEGHEADFVILEPDLAALSKYGVDERVRSALKSPRFHLRALFDENLMEVALGEIASTFPSERVLLHITSSYEKKYDKQKLLDLLLKKVTLISSLYHEQAFYHLLFFNLYNNIKHLPKCFYADALKGSFKKIPAIICGAGPSLASHIDRLKELKNKALIFAGGSAIGALIDNGVDLDLAFAIDPNPDEFKRVQNIFSTKVPLLFSTRLQGEILPLMQSPCGYLRTFSGGPLEQALEYELDLNLSPLSEGLCEEALSVTTLALASAVHMGCDPIILCGVDLAFIDDKKYIDGVIDDPKIEEKSSYSSAPNQVIKQLSREGKEVKTAVKFVMEASALEKFAKKYPEVSFFECYGGGLGVKSFEKVHLSSLPFHALNLDEIVKEKIESCPQFSLQFSKIEGFLSSLQKSLIKVLGLLENLLLRRSELEKNGSVDLGKEDARLTLLEMDIFEENAYKWFLEPLEANIEYLIKESDPDLFYKKKWEHYHRLIKSYLTRF